MLALLSLSFLLLALADFANSQSLSHHVPRRAMSRQGGINQLLHHSCRPIGQGVTVRSDQLHGDNDYCILKNVNSITPEYEMTWEKVEEQPGKYNWDNVDKIYQYAQQHGLDFRGHGAVGWETAPQWAKVLDRDSLVAAIKSHVYTLVKRYPKMVSLVVVNEPMFGSGTDRIRDWAFYNTIGLDYISTAFKTARQANPHVKLILNDYDVEGTIPGYGSAKRDGFYHLVKKLLADEVPIDVVGFESHFKVGSVPKDMAYTMKMFTDLGVEVMITEVDIRIKNGAGVAEYKQQALDFGEVYSICIKNSKCTAVMSWNFNDDVSWLNPQFDTAIANSPWYQGYGSATIFGSKCTTKRSVMNSIISALQRCH